jgi:hypothetical protein
MSVCVQPFWPAISPFAVLASLCDTHNDLLWYTRRFSLALRQLSVNWAILALYSVLSIQFSLVFLLTHLCFRCLSFVSFVHSCRFLLVEPVVRVVFAFDTHIVLPALFGTSVFGNAITTLIDSCLQHLSTTRNIASETRATSILRSMLDGSLEMRIMILISLQLYGTSIVWELWMLFLVLPGCSYPEPYYQSIQFYWSNTLSNWIDWCISKVLIVI